MSFWLKALFACILLTVLVYNIYRVSSSIKCDIKYEKIFEKALGYEIDTPYIRFGRIAREAVVFSRIVEGGVMKKHGVTEGDIFHGRFADFYCRLRDHQGKNFEFEVIDGKSYLDEGVKRIKKIIIPVPDLGL